MSARLRFPKPRRALEQYWAVQYGHIKTKGKTRPPVEYKLLSHIAEHADLLHVPVPRPAPPSAEDNWLLVPAPAWLIDALAAVYADIEDCEPDADLEENGDLEEDRFSDDHEDGKEEDELTIVRPDTMDRKGLTRADDIAATDDQRTRYRARTWRDHLRDIRLKLRAR